MFAEPSFSHNTLWRRVRRRYYLEQVTAGTLFVCPPALCAVSWLLHAPHWLTVWLEACWFLTLMFVTLFTLLMMAISHTYKGSPKTRPRMAWFGFYWTLSFNVVILIALLLGRIDMALYLNFVRPALSAFESIRTVSLRNTLHLALALGLCLAFAKHAVGIVIALLLLDFVRQLCARTTLREVITRLPTRSEYVVRNRELSAKGDKARKMEAELRVECETEQWEIASATLNRYREGQMFRQNEVVWRAIIYNGMERYAEVVDLEAEAERESADISPYLAVAHARLGHIDEALKIAEEAQKLKRPGAELALGEVYFANKQYEPALQWYEVGPHRPIRSAKALRAIGSALVALGDYREARAVYEQAIRLTPFVRPEDLLQLAKCLRETRQENEAAEMERLAHDKA